MRARTVKLAAGAIVLLIVVLAVVVLRSPFSGPGASSRTTTHQIGKVIQGEVIEHVFVLENDESSDVVLREVVPWASTVVSLDSIVPAGGEAQIRIRMDTRNMKGPLNELVKVRFVDERRLPIWLQLRGRVVLPVELAPKEHVYFFAVRGEALEESVEVINHQDEPLEVTGITSSNPYFKAKSDVVERERRYRIIVSLDPEIPVGTHKGEVTVSTDSREYPSLDLLAWARVKDVVSTSISELNFSRLDSKSLNMLAVSRRTVLVEKHQGTNFRVLRATTEVPFLEVEIEPQKPGQSFLVHVTIAEDRAEKGAFEGTLVIETNDPEFARLELPISGDIV